MYDSNNNNMKNEICFFISNFKSRNQSFMVLFQILGNKFISNARFDDIANINRCLANI